MAGTKHGSKKRKAPPLDELARLMPQAQRQVYCVVERGNPKAIRLLKDLYEKMGALSRGVYAGQCREKPEELLEKMYQLAHAITEIVVIMIKDAEVAPHELTGLCYPSQKLIDTIQTIASLYPGIEERISNAELQRVIRPPQKTLAEICALADKQMDVNRLACQSWEDLVKWTSMQREAIHHNFNSEEDSEEA